MDKKDVLKFAEEMIEVLTLRRVILITLFMTLSIAILSIFENRNVLFAMVYKTAEPSKNVIWEMSDVSKKQLKELTNTSNGLVGVVLMTDVDLRKNLKRVKYVFVKDQDDAAIINSVVSKILPQPLFDQDEKNIEQMIAMLTNEFKCSLTSDTVISKIVPSLINKYPTTCRIAVPPYFGEFAGFMTLFLTRKPTDLEINALKIEITRVAIEIYLRDISSRHN